MTPYTQRVWNRLVRAFRLRIESEMPEMRVLASERVIKASGGAKRRRDLIERWALTYYRNEGYLDFQRQALNRTYTVGSSIRRDTVVEIDNHFTVNNAGSIRRIYKHRGTQVFAVRTVSLQNFYMLPDWTVARLVMMTSPSLEWIRDLPVNYHPVTNRELSQMASMDDFIAHFAGQGTVVPRRLSNVFAPGELIQLVQLVPGQYLNTLANILKHEFVPTDRPPPEKLLLAYYRGRVQDADSYLFRVVYSYVKTCRYLGQKLNMRLRCSQRLSAERAAAWQGKEIKLNPEIHTRRDLIIPSGPYGGVTMKLINSRSALRREARLMENCVEDYAGDINAGTCALYHVRYRDEDFTLEVQRDSRGHLCIAQLMGVGNREAPKALKPALKRVLAQADG